MHRTFRRTYLTIADLNEVQKRSTERVTAFLACSTFPLPVVHALLDLDSDFAESDLPGSSIVSVELAKLYRYPQSKKPYYTLEFPTHCARLRSSPHGPVHLFYSLDRSCLRLDRECLTGSVAFTGHWALVEQYHQQHNLSSDSLYQGLISIGTNTSSGGLS
ncbi:hypothetical protein L209DRAFT_113958 [Thermothelomyces heterothallicus CBS 203.75]